jgi:hypothetical protein
MADSDKLNIANRIIKKYTEVVQCFDDWVLLIKANDLEKAAEQARNAKVIRIEIAELKKQLEKLNKKSGIILLN